MGEAIARARGAGRRFGDRHVLVGVDLDVHAGEVLALIGPNGGGKSTLLLLFAGLVSPTTGEVTVGDGPATQAAVARTGSVGLITADPGLYPLLSGWENLVFFASLYGLGDAETRTRAAPHLDTLGLAPDMDRPVGAWSSGMRQKLSLVRALLLQPSLLLLDEPTANLDPLAAHALHVAIRSLADRGLAVVVATHDLANAEAIADAAAVVRGTVVAYERLSGARAPRPAGPLLALYRRFADEGDPAVAPEVSSPLAARPTDAVDRIWRVARREWVEQQRQPAMLGAITLLFTVIAVLSAAALGILEVVAHDPIALASFTPWFPGAGDDGPAFIGEIAGTVVGFALWLVFTQLLGITGVLAGHALLHDRQTGTLPFLLLAPIRRAELLGGKVIGAIAPSIGIYLVVSGGLAVFASTLDVAATQRGVLPPSPAFLLAFFIGGPAWAGAVSTLCAVISGAARDVRTAQQGVWLVMLFATFACGWMLVGLMSRGVLVELGVAVLGLVALGIALASGAGLVSRDLGR